MIRHLIKSEFLRSSMLEELISKDLQENAKMPTLRRISPSIAVVTVSLQIFFLLAFLKGDKKGREGFHLAPWDEVTFILVTYHLKMLYFAFNFIKIASIEHPEVLIICLVLLHCLKNASVCHQFHQRDKYGPETASMFNSIPNQSKSNCLIVVPLVKQNLLRSINLTYRKTISIIHEFRHKLSSNNLWRMTR